MTKNKLEKEADKWLNKWELCNKCENKVDCISNYSYCKKVVLQAYQKAAEPREKQIAELKGEVHTWKEASSANSYKAFQLQEENKILSKHILELQNDKGELTDKCRELEAQIEEMMCCGNCRFSESDKLNGTFCHREGCFVVASAKCKLWEN